MQLLSLIGDRVALACHNVHLINTIRERAAELEILYGKVSYLENFKSDMIRIAAHDLKNPLNVIRNYLSMLINASDPELDIDLDVNQVYPSMMRSAERMMHIIQNFLSLDRIERAAEYQTLEPLDLCLLVTKAQEEFSGRAAQKSQQIAFIAPNEACMVEGDPAQLYEAVANFVSNAIKYTPEGGHIQVRLSTVDGLIKFEVSDDGYGIPDEEQNRLFQPFYRAKSTETASIEGSGLGLHLTKNIIERQGGEIIFDSVYRQGSTFGFLMPLYQQPAEISAGASR
jgi:signal transduction histidine kinase